MKKYVLCPGVVRSQSDGDRHYITAPQLAFLYGVQLHECELFEPASWWTPSYWRMAEERVAGLIRLEPRANGDYRLPAP